MAAQDGSCQTWTEILKIVFLMCGMFSFPLDSTCMYIATSTCTYHENLHLSRLVRKPTICICENKGTDQLRSHCKADLTFVFATWIVQFLFFLNLKFPVSSHLLCLYIPDCVGPVCKPNCWFSHKAAHFCCILYTKLFYTRNSK